MSEISRTIANQKHFKAVILACFLSLSSASLSTNSAGASEISALFGLSPDNSQELPLRTLKRSQKEAVINIYQISEPHVMKTISELMKKISP